MTISQRWICLSLLMLACTGTGCMQTRYAESNSLLNAHSGECPCGSHHQATFRERRWSGLWFSQPAYVEP
jgi:hypothetical protein